MNEDSQDMATNDDEHADEEEFRTGFGVDFTHNGMSLNEWLGMLPHEAVLKAADVALARPDERIIVGIARTTEPQIMPRWSHRERGLLRSWVRTHYPDLQGRLRLATSTELEPSTGQDYAVAVVVHEPGWQPRSKS